MSDVFVIISESEIYMDLNIHPPMPRRKNFRIGILGSGFIVNECHLVAYRKAGFKPVAIASRNRANAEQAAARHNIARVYDTYDALLDDASIEVLDIAVPPQALKDLVLKACKRKTVKGILAQKPLGVNYEQAEEMVKACEAAGITLAVNQNMRYDQSVRAAKTLLGNGTIGEPVFATIDMRGIPHWQPWQAELGWATLRIMSIHHLDTFRYWFGEPERIFCSTRPDPRTQFPHRDGICVYILEYTTGLRCLAIDDPWTGPAKEGCPADIGIKWRIEGLNGLAMGDIGWCKDSYTTPSTIRYAAKGDKEFHTPTWTESWFPDAFAGTMGDLLIALEEGKAPGISGRDNLKTMQLVDAAYISSQVHEAVEPDDAIRNVAKPSKWKWWKKAWSALVTPVKPIQSSALSKPAQTFTWHAQIVLALARKEANRLQHNFVGTEHVLLGILKLSQGGGYRAIKGLGANTESMRTEIENMVGTGSQQNANPIPFTPRVKKVLARAARQVKAMRHEYVGTEHFLLGLLEESDGIAGRVLTKMGISLGACRAEVLRLYTDGHCPEPLESALASEATPVNNGMGTETGTANK